MNKILITTLAAMAALTASAQDFSFDSLSTGALNGQDGWTAPSQASIVADPTGGTTNFSGNVLSLTGSVGDPMNTWAVNSLSGTPDFSMDVWMDAGINTDPAELFTRFNGWTNYVAIKWGTQGDAATGILEVPGGSLTGVTLPISTVFNLAADYASDGSSVEFFVDGGSVGSIGSLSLDLVSGPNIEFRSQKVQTYVDNFTVVPEPSTYAALLGLMALGFVAWRRRK